MKLPVFATLLILTACTTIRTRDVTEIRSIVRACVYEQVGMCGDLICEGDTSDPETVMVALGDAVDFCLQHPEFIDEYYFDSEVQEDLKSYWTE